ncbi:MAG: VWA domain-containing protein [Chloroflexi bacterium]|nr:VWA domain-containing protein [Chloroflexota bacterium]
MHRYRYSRWDGLRQLDLPADALLDQIADDVLFHGDVEQALRKLLQQGARDRRGERLNGMQDLLRQLKARRQELLQQYQLDGLYQRLREDLDQAIAQERRGIQQRLDQMDQGQAGDEGAPGDAAAQFGDLLRQIAAKNLSFLDALPDDLGGQVQALQEYDFLDQEARGRFQQVLGELQRAVLDSFFQDLSQRLQRITPEEMAEVERMVRALNRMLETRIQGRTPEFERFLEEFGHYFGDTPPPTLDALLEQVQEHMAQMQSLLNSLSYEQQRALRDLVNRRLLSPGLDEALSALAQTLWEHFSHRYRGRSYAFSGTDPLSLEQALHLMERLHRMDELERQFDRVRFGAPPEEVDRATLRDLLGDAAVETLDTLAQVAHQLEAAGLVERTERGVVLTPRGVRQIGQKALADIFRGLKKSTFGNHRMEGTGQGSEVAEETRPYEYGQPFFLHLERTLRNALARESGVPVRLAPQDFEVYHTERMTRTATVLMLDLSRSMPMRGNFTAAKKVALALHQLIRTQFPRDHLYLVGFSGFAREVKSEDLPRIEVGEFGRGTNMQAGLMVARKLLSRHKGGTRQVIMITDGEPTACYEPNGQIAIEFPPSGRVLRATLSEVQRCTREDITINLFMLGQDSLLRGFVEQLARSNRGRVFFTSADHLGEYLLVDYLAHKRRIIG